MNVRVLIPTMVLLLAACSSYAPPASLDGLDRGSIIARMGPPDVQRPVDGATRLEFSRGPYGHHTWFVDLDSTGKVIRARQVLTEQNFLRIVPGMAQDAVRDQLGRPSEQRVLGRSRGAVWNYRYENPFCLWFQVEIGADGKVRSSGHGTPPECERDPPILRP